MNCEVCKSKKATLFYADEGGIRHALCTECGESINKLGKVEKAKDQVPKYIPEPSLCSFIERVSDLSAHVKRDTRPRAACQSCGCSLEEITESGKFGCPDCYESFDDSIITRYSGVTDFAGGRMPSSHRSDLDRQALLESLRSDLRGAINDENFELAASLRDKIKKLEEKTKIHN
jgi:protein arginine kinase activator